MSSFPTLHGNTSFGQDSGFSIIITFSVICWLNFDHPVASGEEKKRVPNESQSLIKSLASFSHAQASQVSNLRAVDGYTLDHSAIMESPSFGQVSGR